MTELVIGSLFILGIALVYFLFKKVKYNRNRKIPFSDTLKSNNLKTKE